MRSIAIDTNLLILWIAGSCDPARIGHTRRLKNFEAGDLQIVHDFVNDFERHVSLPNVLTEASNLMFDDGIEIARGAAEVFKRYVASIDERFIRSEDIVRQGAFDGIGITDGALLLLARQGVTIFSDDFRLCGRVTALGGQAQNFNHLRWGAMI